MNHDIIYVGVDVHEKESQLAVLEKGGSILLEERIPTNNLHKFISSLPGEKRVAIESVGFIHPIYEKLSSVPKCTVSVANPNKLRLISQSSTKNDSNDARVLGDLLRTNYLPLAHMRDEETREKLFVVKDRVNYGTRRGHLRGTIRWLLKRRGIDLGKGLFGREGRERLRALRLQEIDIRLDELELVESTIERLDGQIRDIVSKDTRARLVDTIPGVASYTALFVACALDDIDRFPDSKHACAYLGLVPWLDQTADMTHLGHITKKGDKWLRRNLIECARVAVRKDPHINEFYTRLTHKRGEKKALIAVARKLVSYAYWMLKKNVTYEELSPWR
ncbi:MAG: IS110 family transposase [Nitrososphaerota archaeon]|jgi:transposase|nr:IS110 family transposase [Nitrososphaerota archaeon]MDG6987663.1 IS110 family transposase [Nitrososphaerota archaeon]